MKKVRENPKLNTGCVRLYMDDIVSIVESMQEISEKGELKITVGGYEFPSLEKLVDLKQKEHQEIEIEYKTDSPYSRYSLSISKKNSYLSYYSPEDSAIFKGVFLDIERLINSRRLKWGWVETFFYTTASFGTLISILLLQGQVNNEPIITNIGFALGVIMLIAFALFLFTIPVRVSKIILVEKIEHNTFWKRNKDISSISSVVSFLLGILGTLFVQSLGK
jgi:hypothetical protein